MKTISEDLIDKSGWPDGPWIAEPDKLQWKDQATGLPCLIVRHDGLGHLCGYVGVDKTHQAFEKDFDSVVVGDKEYPAVHGGLTYSRKCSDHVCHLVEPGEDGDIWWLGFDMAHSGDFSPNLGMAKLDKNSDKLSLIPGFENPMGNHESYKNITYVKIECEYLAQQLKDG